MLALVATLSAIGVRVQKGTYAVATGFTAGAHVATGPTVISVGVEVGAWKTYAVAAGFVLGAAMADGFERTAFAGYSASSTIRIRGDIGANAVAAILTRCATNAVTAWLIRIGPARISTGAAIRRVVWQAFERGYAVIGLDNRNTSGDAVSVGIRQIATTTTKTTLIEAASGTAAATAAIATTRTFRARVSARSAIRGIIERFSVGAFGNSGHRVCANDSPVREGHATSWFNRGGLNPLFVPVHLLRNIHRWQRAIFPVNVRCPVKRKPGRKLRKIHINAR